MACVCSLAVMLNSILILSWQDFGAARSFRNHSASKCRYLGMGAQAQCWRYDVMWLWPDEVLTGCRHCQHLTKSLLLWMQVSWHGYAGSLGGGIVDYLGLDKISAPPEYQAHFDEKMLYTHTTYILSARPQGIGQVFQNDARAQPSLFQLDLHESGRWPLFLVSIQSFNRWNVFL